MPFLSKSKYLSGLQCSKLLWSNYHAKQLFPPVDSGTQAIFDQGHEVGQLAKTLFPGGIEVAGEHTDFSSLFWNTQEALVHRRPVFEGTFKYQNGFCRVDVLVPVKEQRVTAKAPRKDGRKISRGDAATAAKDENGLWDIIEVKSSTTVKEVNLHDLALQRYVVEGSGMRVRKCILMHINNEYVRRGEVEPKKLFVQEDVTEQVGELLGSVEGNLKSMMSVVRALSGILCVSVLLVN